MQKLKRRPLLTPLVDTLQRLLGFERGLLGILSPFGKPLVIALIVTMVLTLAMCSVACVPQTKTVRPSLPPQAEARDMPAYDGQTFRDSILYLIEVREWGMQCEADKSVIRKVYGHE